MYQEDHLMSMNEPKNLTMKKRSYRNRRSIVLTIGPYMEVGCTQPETNVFHNSQISTKHSLKTFVHCFQTFVIIEQTFEKTLCSGRVYSVLYWDYMTLTPLNE